MDRQITNQATNLDWIAATSSVKIAAYPIYQASPSPEYDAFRELTEKLVAVPAVEIKQKRDADSRGKSKDKPKKKPAQKKSSS
jgi:hypothetical protein